MKKLCVSLMALVALLCVSCSNDPEIPEKNDNGIDVTLSITTNPLTKALETNQVGEKAPIDPTKDLLVYFMDASSSTVASYKLTGAQITAIQSGSGFKFTNLDPSVVNVYVVANVPSSTSPATDPGTTLTAINAKAQNISDQQTANAASVVLANKDKAIVSTGSTTGTASNGNLEFKAAIELTPIVSRIQIKKVSADATITSFKLEGIYIDNFYPQMTIGGAFTSITIQHATDKATFDATQVPYTTTNLYDEDKTEGLVQNPFGAATPQVYGYQIFPTTSTAHENVPYIILRISNIVTSSAATRNIPAGTYYVAVKAYKIPSASTSVTAFSPGNIYTVEDIVVSEKNLVTDPTKSLINVTVNVTVKAWGSINLDPDFGY
ncbi:MAG: hypothetical protein LIR40_11615 [Bacteroidota bacterium]|nr:hypothetical protein [Bacteroidota bacterium]